MANSIPAAVPCRAVRTALGLTQAQWAAVVNVNPMTVSKWERGRLFPDARMQAILAGLSTLSPGAAGLLGTQLLDALESQGALEAFRLLLAAGDTKERGDG